MTVVLAALFIAWGLAGYALGRRRRPPVVVLKRLHAVDRKALERFARCRYTSATAPDDHPLSTIFDAQAAAHIVLESEQHLDELEP